MLDFINNVLKTLWSHLEFYISLGIFLLNWILIIMSITFLLLIIFSFISSLLSL